MGGENPYIKKPEVPSQFKRPFKVKVANQGIEFTVDPKNPPTSGTGLPGSILDMALAQGADIDHACGGVCACSTCHIIVQDGLNSCSESTEDEEDQLDKAPGLTPKSRLACQCVPDGSQDIVIEVPNWNRNLARE